MPSTTIPWARSVAWWCRRGHVAGLARDLAHHLRAHVLERVRELDLAATTTPELMMTGGP